MLVPTLTEALSGNHQSPRGFDRSCWATDVSSSRLTTAGIHNSGWCRGRADGRAYCTGRRFRGQIGIDRKSSSANFAAHGINFYYWNGRAAPQVTFCQGEIPLTNLLFKLGISLACAPFLVLFFLYCRRLIINTIRDSRSLFHFKDIY